MMLEKDILQDAQLRKTPFDVPQGYFEGLKDRLDAIPSAGGSVSVPRAAAPTAWERFRPYVALAAAFLVMVTVGTALLRKTATDAIGVSDFERLQYADLIPMTDPYSIYDVSDDADMTVSDEDIIAYLINTGTALEHIGYEENQ